jgi:hypothetical protein
VNAARLKGRLQVIPGPTGAPWAVLSVPTAADTPADTAWCGEFHDLKTLELGGRLLPVDAIFCAELTARWRRLVVCTPAFRDAALLSLERNAAAWPHDGFFLEVFSS